MQNQIQTMLAQIENITKTLESNRNGSPVQRENTRDDNRDPLQSSVHYLRTPDILILSDSIDPEFKH